MDFRIIPVRKRPPDQYDSEGSFLIPVTVVNILKDRSSGPVIRVFIERLDFFTGQMKKTKAITFRKSVGLFDDLGLTPPFRTDAIVHKKNGKLEFKVVGAYNAGLLEQFYSVQEDNLENNEQQIKSVYNSNYQELRNWIGSLNSNISDIADIR